ncbi:DUF418 domain-containing protein [Erythrobacter sp. SD-21]|uniref:DUF418 domain-containing protein n=1 Tax=Erythrobacter sp. SD-21 TaxID=161528 RepID=UPI0002FA69E5|nr:DUF418 domain-containing protein [Erythrobacter sp. SD-21]
MTSSENASATPDRPQPIAVEGGRIASLDFIRGIAVMGILAANIVSMGQPFTAYMYPEAFTTGHSAAEDWMWAAQLLLIDGKMRGLFTVLFGAGLYLFMGKAWAKGASRWLQVRRLLWLGLFGLLHFYLIWRGDILFAYAVSGLIAVSFFIGMKAKTQLVLGLLGYLCGGIFYGVSMIFMQMTVDGPEPDSAALSQVRSEFVKAAETDLADGRRETAIRQDGSYAELVEHTLDKHGFDPLVNIWLFAFETLPLMLIGMALYRFGIFSGRLDQRRQRLWGWAGLVVGGGLTAWIAMATMQGGFTYYGVLAAFLGWSHFPRLFMTLGLVALLAAYASRAGGWLAERVSATGRAAFTNYLGTSLVMLVVFGNWGLDLFGVLGRSELYLVVLAAWLVMLAWSKPWLERFRYGPLEWLWRCLTYGRVFALRR